MTIHTTIDIDLRPMRLLEVLEPSGGGSGRHFLDLCRGMQARGHVVHAVYSPVRAEPRFVDELRALGLAGMATVIGFLALGGAILATLRLPEGRG